MLSDSTHASPLASAGNSNDWFGELRFVCAAVDLK
jgi:hypothetical protein